MIQIPEADLAALRLRLRQTRWPTRWPSSSLFPGVAQDEVRRLAGYWADGYDWRAQEAAIKSAPTHGIFHTLMYTELGFARYGAHGGNLSAGYTSQLGQQYPTAVAGIHLMALADPADYDPAGVTPEDRKYLDESARWMNEEGGYEHS